MRLQNTLGIGSLVAAAWFAVGQIAHAQSITYFPVDDSLRPINEEPPARTSSWAEYPDLENQPGGCASPDVPEASFVSPVMTSELMSELKTQIRVARNWLQKSALPQSISLYGPKGEIYVYCQKQRQQKRGIPRGLDGWELEFTEDAQIATRLSVMPVYPEISSKAARFMSIGAGLVNRRLRDDLIITLHNNNTSLFGAGEDRDAVDKLIEGSDWVFNSGYVGALAYAATLASVQTSGLDYSSARYSDKIQRPLFMPGRFDQPIYLNNFKVNPEHSASSFWYYFWQRHLPDEGKFFELVEAVGTTENTMAEVDAFLDRYDTGYYDGFEHAFANFAGWHASLWENYAPGVTEDEWLEDNFGGCHQLSVDEMTPYSSIEIDIQEYSALCVELSADSAARAWHGQRLFRLTGSKELIDNVYVAFAEQEVKKQRMSCGAWLAEHAFGDCLVIPTQSFDEETQIAARYFQKDGMTRKAGETQNVPSRIMITYSPSEHTPYELVSKPGEPLKVTLSLDLTSIEEGWFADSDLKSAYGRKRGLTPAGPPPTLQVSSIDENVMDGSSVAIDPGMLKASLRFAENAISVSDEDGNTLTFTAKESSALSPLKQGRVSTIVSGTLASGALITADPDKESFLEILEVNETSARYEGTANVCIATLAQMMRAGMNNQDGSPCEVGEQRKVKVSGAIPFPFIWTAEGAPAAWETENFRKLRKMRLARISQGPLSIRASAGPANAIAPKEFQAPANSSPKPPSAETNPGVCALNNSSGACDCSCGAKVCFDRLERAGALPANAMACRLSCGKDWKSCS